MNITEEESGSMRFFAARTGAKDVVTIRGSVLGGYYMLGRSKYMVPRIATGILDTGTSARSKDDIRSSLSKRGATLFFMPGGDRTHFYATCLPEDAEFIFKLIAECLTEATFPPKEFELQKKRTLSELEETKTDAGSRASYALSPLIYDKDHVNYIDSIATEIAQVQAMGRKDLQAYRKLLGQGGLVLAIAGDIAPTEILAKARRIFSKLPNGTNTSTEKRMNRKLPSAAETHIQIPDKATIDMQMGVHIPMTRENPLFLALAVLTNMLGGNTLSTNHLSRTIRERDGLTYGISASLVNFDGLSDGMLRIRAMFSPDIYDRAVEATKKEISLFARTSHAKDQLLQKKDEMIGRYAVGLATTNGLAGMLHSIGIEGKPLSYIDEYPSLINALTIKDLKEAAAIVPWDSLSIAAAGTFTKKK
jgi:zinc protease